MRPGTAALLAVLCAGPFMGGCGGGQTGGLAPVLCGQVEVRPLAPDDLSPVGPTAGELVEAIERDSTTTLEWESGATSTVAVSIRAVDGGEVSLVTTGPSSLCASFVEIDAELSLVSADGTIVGSAPATLRVTGDAVLLQASGLDASAVVARPDLADLELDRLVAPDLVVDLDVSTEAPAGDVSVRGQSCSAPPGIGGEGGSDGDVGADGEGGSDDCAFSTVRVARIGGS